MILRLIALFTLAGATIAVLPLPSVSQNLAEQAQPVLKSETSLEFMVERKF